MLPRVPLRRLQTETSSGREAAAVCERGWWFVRTAVQGSNHARLPRRLQSGVSFALSGPGDGCVLPGDTGSQLADAFQRLGSRLSRGLGDQDAGSRTSSTISISSRTFSAPISPR